MIPRFKPFLGLQEFLQIFSKSKFNVEEFEDRFSSLFSVADSVAFPYGRSALLHFLSTVGVSDSEIIMPSYSCSVVAHSIVLSGNTPVFVDISIPDFNMDTDLLETSFTKKTKAIIATHLFGNPMNIDLLEQLVKTKEKEYGHKIWLIQDCAHSFDVCYKNRSVISSGDVSLFGLNISKSMTSVFGGMLTFNDIELADKVRLHRDSKLKKPNIMKSLKRRIYLLAVFIAFSSFFYSLTYYLQTRTKILKGLTDSYHLDEKIHFPEDSNDIMIDFEASIGVLQIEKYRHMIKTRQQNAAILHSKIVTKGKLKTFPPIEGSTYSHFVCLVDDKSEWMKKAEKKGIQLGEIIQYSIPSLPPYIKKGKAFPVSEMASKKAINLPIHPSLSWKDLNSISEFVNEV